MPPRHVYWTIILEGKPTSFRAHTRDELLPTFKQLQARHTDIQLKWFARGRLWESPEEERAASRRGGEERRGPSWRPGGTHEDPRERFVCECASAECSKVVELTGEEYTSVRAVGTRFVVFPEASHVRRDLEDVVERHDRYWVVEKRGEAGDVAEALVERPGDPL